MISVFIPYLVARMIGEFPGGTATISAIACTMILLPNIDLSISTTTIGKARYLMAIIKYIRTFPNIFFIGSFENENPSTIIAKNVVALPVYDIISSIIIGGFTSNQNRSIVITAAMVPMFTKLLSLSFLSAPSISRSIIILPWV